MTVLSVLMTLSTKTPTGDDSTEADLLHSRQQKHYSPHCRLNHISFRVKFVTIGAFCVQRAHRRLSLRAARQDGSSTRDLSLFPVHHSPLVWTDLYLFIYMNAY